MRPVLLLVDLQNDFLNAPGLEPAAAAVVRMARRLLAGARAASVPVVHALTSVDASRDDRMPHWKALGKWRCVRGTDGHAVPAGLSPLPGEATVSKTFFSAFSSPELEAALAAAGADTLIVAGVHLHGCIRATVLDGYQRGLEIWVAEDAVGSDDPLHGAVTRRYLEARAARFAGVEELLARFGGRDFREKAGGAPIAAAAALAVAAARAASEGWRALTPDERSLPLAALAERLESERSALARQMAADVGKPVTQGEAEVTRTAELLRRAAALPAQEPRRAGPDSALRRVPLGVVAAITPWNNPLAIPWGKLGPALALGNTAVWKPAPAATPLAERSLVLAREAGLPDGAVCIVPGDHRAASAVMNDPGVDAVSLSGSSLAGWAAQEICARRRIPLQAELGGNNAAIVWTGADIGGAAERVAQGAFAFAGQRCTANRRAVVSEALFDEFLDAVVAAVAALRWGNPLDPETEVGPMVSEEARDRVAEAVAAASSQGARLLTPHGPPPQARGAWYPPTLVVEASPGSAIVQEETFGPVLVLQSARSFEEALELANGVRQGLVAALFAGPGSWRAHFDVAARAGVLKWDTDTSGADAHAPFGGWKSSGLGPPEHGPGDVEFYSRLQAIYGGP